VSPGLFQSEVLLLPLDGEYCESFVENCYKELGDIRASYLVWQLQAHERIFPLKYDKLAPEEKACDFLQDRFYAYQVSETEYVIGDHLLNDTPGCEEQILIPKIVVERGDIVNYFKHKVLQRYLF
jgi:hypothetical protein